MNPKSYLSVDAFVRSVAINRGRPICLLIGAGASISSGMPSAQRCIWEWKKDIFATNNPTLQEAVGELSLPGTKQRIQKWLDNRGSYPTLNDPNEYSFYADACYPTGLDRRTFFQSHVSKAIPHVGYRLLPLLAKAGLIQDVWTTNFDGLVARVSAAENLTCVEVGIDTQHRILRIPASGELRVISMHGDYRYDDLKNTAEELQQQETALRAELVRQLQGHDFVVLGYSGRDDSIMRSLTEGYQGNTNCRLFWCGFGNEIPPSTQTLIETARANGKDAFYIAADGFDDLLSRLALRQLEGDLLASAKTILETSASSVSLPAAFNAPTTDTTALIKSNAYPLTFPPHALKLILEIPTECDQREWIEERLPITNGALVIMDNAALALADSKEISQAFGTALKSSPIIVALSEEDVAKDGRIRSLIRRSLVMSIAERIDASTDGSRRLWEKTYDQERPVNGIKYKVHRALAIRLEMINEKLHVVLMPEYIATNAKGELADREATKLIRTAIYGFQHNHVFDADLKHWIQKISDIDTPSRGGGMFRIDRAPIYAGLFQKNRQVLPPAIQRHAQQRGLVVRDADLIFSSSNGKIEIKNPNPLKGLVENKPWDFQLTLSGLSPSVEIATICPSRDASKLKRFLNQFQERSEPSQAERDYLQNFPGFSSAFGLPLTYPNQGSPSWIDLDDNVSGDAATATKELAHRICRALDTIRSLRPGAIVAIFVPFRWAEHEKIETDTERFDLHHFLKAYAARHGQSTQFIREKTTITPQPCRIRWWLSLALYAKALRTPWRLDCLDDETAFVGIGYSIDRDAAKGNHVLLDSVVTRSESRERDSGFGRRPEKSGSF